MTHDLITTNQPKSPPPKNKGGRPKGSRNRSSHLLKTAQIEIEKMFGTKDFDPAVFLQTIAADPDRTIEVRIVAASKVLPYIYSPAKPAVIDENGKKKPVNVEALMGKIARDLMLEGKITTKEEPPEEDEDESDDEDGGE